MSQPLVAHPVFVVIRRDLEVALLRRSDALIPLFFFVVVVSLFPLGIGPEREILRRIAPGVLWVSALLASMLSLNRLFEQDHADGTLEQMMLSPAPLAMLVVGKITAHWLLSGLPLALLAPALALQFDLPASSLWILTASLAIGTPVLSLIGAVGAGLTLGVRAGGVLVAVLVLPLYIPVLIFGAGAVDASILGQGASANLSLLAAVFVLAAFFTPFATSASLRIALEY
ncbi:heme exporter protein CcmB [Stenotrophomonas maltophilia]|uniref:Heme exporter protein B n=3 Tax=Achromobacter TaxID=222 RepID=A0A9X3KZ18_ALCXX|nr:MULTISPECIES: heme exporter protein CcmB [Pseudomonadota]MBA0394135.1 heme exporter protein CcmB [Stenotrophomonas maltophilia]HBO80481.1 heme exporter protein CcmB [Cupriavidus sp.]MBG0867423.1 heme exporter protein CcmB [Burkholderia sp. 9779_493]MBH1366722.1 heme exporter protein CcmB [Stenotrophomonas maltophilia]MBH1434251.1 heme exporter protein CcmB [Stenotrophomonas maltophilia]